ncbi:MAG: extracellular solute-binding protein [Treponema sp.]|jgi:putative aldouronate transport system substrate-binding protein|nr:extracellular solute-binding protein [Treponema sp.]
MKRILVMLMALTVSAGAFAAGSSQTAGKTPGTVNLPKGSLPISDGSVTLTVFAGGLSQWVTSFDYKDNIFTKQVVDETGIKLEFVTATTADAAQKRNILLSSGDYPDIFIGGGVDIAYYASQGILLPLDAYEPLSYPNIKAAFDRYPTLWNINRGTDGKLYGLPGVNECLHCNYSNGRALYFQPWVRDNKLKAPETLDEFTAYLRWIRDNDVNGNGNKNDEIPLTWEKSYVRHAVAIIAKAYMPFIYNQDYYGLSLNDNRQVVEQYKDPNYRRALQYMAGLYKEGLILPDSFAQTRDQLKALVENPTPLVGVAMCANPDNIGIAGGDRVINYFFLKPLAGPEGLRHASYRGPYAGLGTSMVITDNCKYPELAIALYNYLIDPVVARNAVGPKGSYWDDPDPGSISLMGGKPAYKNLTSFAAQQVNGGWNQTSPGIFTADVRLSEQAVDFDLAKQYIQTGDAALHDRMVKNPSWNEEFLFISTNELFVPYKINDKYFIPPSALLRMNDNDNARFADIKATLETFVEQATVEFITGSRDVNNDTAWNTYLTELDRMGSKDIATLIQKYIK